jgi:hypothetical protein
MNATDLTRPTLQAYSTARISRVVGRVPAGSGAARWVLIRRGRIGQPSRAEPRRGQGAVAGSKYQDNFQEKIRLKVGERCLSVQPDRRGGPVLMPNGGALEGEEERATARGE